MTGASVAWLMEVSGMRAFLHGPDAGRDQNYPMGIMGFPLDRRAQE
jgi:hypothetical protein